MVCGIQRIATYSKAGLQMVWQPKTFIIVIGGRFLKVEDKKARTS
jgi:hypothetical protein